MVESKTPSFSSLHIIFQWNPVESTILGGGKRTHPKLYVAKDVRIAVDVHVCHMQTKRRNLEENCAHQATSDPVSVQTWLNNIEPV